MHVADVRAVDSRTSWGGAKSHKEPVSVRPAHASNLSPKRSPSRDLPELELGWPSTPQVVPRGSWRATESSGGEDDGPPRGANQTCNWCACGVHGTSMFRKGPDGPKTLCNTCGQYWSSHKNNWHEYAQRKKESARARGAKVTAEDECVPGGTLSQSQSSEEEVSDTWHCGWCGIDSKSTFQLRKGPGGPKTLCNTCGQYWSAHRTDWHAYARQKRRARELKAGASSASEVSPPPTLVKEMTPLSETADPPSEDFPSESRKRGRPRKTTPEPPRHLDLSEDIVPVQADEVTPGRAEDFAPLTPPLTSMPTWGGSRKKRGSSSESPSGDSDGVKDSTCASKLGRVMSLLDLELPGGREGDDRWIQFLQVVELETDKVKDTRPVKREPMKVVLSTSDSWQAAESGSEEEFPKQRKFGGLKRFLHQASDSDDEAMPPKKAKGWSSLPPKVKAWSKPTPKAPFKKQPVKEPAKRKRRRHFHDTDEEELELDDEARCTKNNGRGWECRRGRYKQSKYCALHQRPPLHLRPWA